MHEGTLRSSHQGGCCRRQEKLTYSLSSIDEQYADNIACRRKTWQGTENCTRQKGIIATRNSLFQYTRSAWAPQSLLAGLAFRRLRGLDSVDMVNCLCPWFAPNSESRIAVIYAQHQASGHSRWVLYSYGDLMPARAETSHIECPAPSNFFLLVREPDNVLVDYRAVFSGESLSKKYRTVATPNQYFGRLGSTNVGVSTKAV
jgi:hypothetical protein